MSPALDVEAVLKALTLEEKASLTSGSAFWYTAPVDRLGVPRLLLSDGPHGLRAQPGEGDHLGIGGAVAATCFPTASAVASSWDPGLLHEIGQALAAEARAAHLSVILGPGINMKRSPLCGRNFEYLSEDPHLSGELAVGIVDGIQSGGIGTSLKHFAANNQETDRLRVDAQVDERTLREIYLPAFERVVTASQPWTVMCSYNKVNGTSSSENSWLLTTVLREEFGFEGLVVSDWGAVYDRVPALLAGTDLEMPPALGYSPQQVEAAVTSGRLPEQVLDERVRKVLELVNKSLPALQVQETFDVEAHHRLARRAAAESVVLLANDGLLPLAPSAHRVAVIGEFARTPRFQGAGSSQVTPTRVDTLLEEMSGSYADVTFAAGYGLDQHAGDSDQIQQLLQDAQRVARAAQTVVVVVGLPEAAESEGYDRTDMNLPADQLQVLREVAAVNPNVIAVLVNGSTVLLDEVLPHARAVIEAWLGGQAAAGGLTDVITGAVNPSGRLAETVPLRLEDNSSYLNFPGEHSQVRYGEGIFIGYRGYDKSGLDVAFPFGFGLSYTSFTLSDLSVDVRGHAAHQDLSARVEVTVTNTGTCAGAEVVQVYVADPQASVTRPVRELKGFAKTHLEAGQSQRISIELDQRAFSYWSPVQRSWVVETGDFEIQVGHSSRDLPLVHVISVHAPSVAATLTTRSTLAEWLADDQGRALIEAEVAAGQPAGVLGSEMIEMVGTAPIATLANFAGLFLDHESVTRIAEQRRAADEPRR